jgi:8-oxo-dGTP pyrophosphatase MutT (NUDIX family)
VCHGGLQRAEGYIRTVAPHPIPRPTGRILLVDDAERVLLFSSLTQPGGQETYWFTPGGGVQDDETITRTAVRELAEETGHLLAEDRIGPVVATCSGQWAAGEQVFLATDSYFFVRVSDPTVDTSGHEPLERSVITGYRWWTVPELEATGDLVFPVGLAGLLRQLLTAGHPAQPVPLPWNWTGG